jgi:hypothetical protein
VAVTRFAPTAIQPLVIDESEALLLSTNGGSHS